MFVQKELFLSICLDCCKGLNFKTKLTLFIFKIRYLRRGFTKKDLIDFLRGEKKARISHGFCFDCVTARYPDIEFNKEKIIHRIKHFFKD